jgi:hypothetical protein
MLCCGGTVMWGCLDVVLWCTVMWGCLDVVMLVLVCGGVGV